MELFPSIMETHQIQNAKSSQQAKYSNFRYRPYDHGYDFENADFWSPWTISIFWVIPIAPNEEAEKITFCDYVSTSDVEFRILREMQALKKLIY